MKTHLTSGLILLILLTFVGSLGAQWSKTNGPTGGFAGWVAASGQNAYVGIDAGYGGVYLTTDNGADWALSTRVDYFSGMLIDGQNYFATIGPYKDLGSIWISNDAGKSWNLQKVNPSGGRIYCLYGSSTNLFAGTDTGAYSSIDAGKTWTARTGGIADRIYSITQLGSVLFAGSWSTGLYTSTNGGTTWVNGNSNIAHKPGFFYPVYTIAAFGNAVFAGGLNGVFRTTDNGAHWDYAHAGLGADTSCLALSTNGSVLLFASYTSGFLYQWNNASDSWTKISDHAGGVAFGASAWFMNAFRGPLVSLDHGVTWTQQNSGIVTPSGAIAISGGSLYCDKGGDMYVSADQANSWPAVPVNTPANGATLTYNAIRSMSPSGTDLIASINIIGTGDMYRITNNGTLQTSILGKNSFFSVAPASGILDLGGEIVASAEKITDYVTGISHSGVFTSADDAQTFVRQSSGIDDTLISCIATDGTTIYAGTEFGKLYKSTDNAQSWSFMGQIATDGIYSIALSGSTMLYTTSSGFFVTKDFGAHSVLHNEGLGAASITFLAVDSKYIYASTDSGVMRRLLNDFLEVSKQHSAANLIGSIYPNPVTSTAIVSYSIPYGAKVECKVIDVLGRMIWSQAEDEPTEGVYSLHIDTDRWTTGSYKIVISLNGVRAATMNLIRE